jgi:acetyl-CoA carboxylase biotin carboxyl carrier protein
MAAGHRRRRLPARPSRDLYKSVRAPARPPAPRPSTIATVGLSRDDLLALMDAFEASEWTELVLTANGTRVELSRTGRPPESAAPVPSPSPAAAVAPRAAPPSAGAPGETQAPASPPATAAAAPPSHRHGTHTVLAPSVGIFYRAPEPGAPAFVEEGAHVDPDDIVCIVEVMKLMNHVKAGAAGVVRAIHVENGAMIEHGQTLVTIELED